jgi:hypothetical protein
MSLICREDVNMNGGSGISSRIDVRAKMAPGDHIKGCSMLGKFGKTDGTANKVGGTLIRFGRKYISNYSIF